MKKICILSFILFTLIFFCGCNQKIDIMSQFSEITKLYYSGVSADGQMRGMISVGEREEPYIIDGKHGANTDFSLIVLRFQFVKQENQITVDFYSGQVKNSVILEYNPLNNTFMADLGYSLKSDGDYSIKYGNYVIEFYEESESFKVDYEQAIKKSLNELGDRISLFYKGERFIGECYLKILNRLDDEIDNLYWIFTIVGGNGESSNVVINIQDGAVILSN